MCPGNAKEGNKIMGTKSFLESWLLDAADSPTAPLVREGFDGIRERVRSLVVARPFHKHIILFEVAARGVELRRAMHGHRDLPCRLREAPGAS